MSSVPSGTGSAEMSLDVPEAIEEASPPAFLPPSDDVSGSVATSDSKRIWMAAERLCSNMCAIRRRAPPTEVNRITIAAQITRVLRPRDADMSEQAWEQRAREQLPIMGDTRRPGNVATLVNIVADAMERAAGILRGRLGALALFAPEFMYWQQSLQQFVYILLEVCKARRIDFAICAPNLRVDHGDLRPDALSYPAFFAAISRILIAVERSGNAQLTIDDAVLLTMECAWEEWPSTWTAIVSCESPT